MQVGLRSDQQLLRSHEDDRGGNLVDLAHSADCSALQLLRGGYSEIPQKVLEIQYHMRHFYISLCFTCFGVALM